MKNLITLVMGDWSHDGHGKSKTIYIQSNLSQKKIIKAYSDGSEKLGFDLISNVCSEWEDNELPKTELLVLIKAGMDPQQTKISSYTTKEMLESLENDEDEFGLAIHAESFSLIYLFIVKLGNPKFTYKILTREEAPIIDINGYGLFN